MCDSWNNYPLPPLRNFAVSINWCNLLNMAGRPTDYDENIPGKVKEYLETCVDEIKQVIIGESEKFTSYKEKVIVKLPTIEGLARFIGCHKDTIYEWERKHPQFSDVLSTLRNEQAARLINSGLGGEYNSLIAKLLLGKHGYADKTAITDPDGNEVKSELTDTQFNKLLNAISNPC